MLTLFRRLFVRQPTFCSAAREWFSAISCQRQSRNVIRQIERDLLPRFSSRPLGSITRRDLADAIMEVSRTHGPSSAAHLLSYSSRFFRWAVARGYLEHAPTEHLSARTLIGPAKRSGRVLTVAELTALWRATDDGSDFSRIVRLLILTGCRRSEIGGLRWAEIDLADRLITLPPARVKTAHPFLIPLSALAIAQLPKPRPGCVFGRGQGFSGWSRAKRRLDRRAGLTGWTLHDIRRSVVTAWHEEGLAEPWVIEAAVGHLSGYKGGVAGLYNRAQYLPERRALADRWAQLRSLRSLV